MSVTISGTNANGETMELWWNDGYQMTQITLEKQAIVDDPVSDFINWAAHPLMVALYMVICAGVLVLWIRRDNRIDIEYDEDEDDDFDEEADEDDDFDEEADELYDEEYDLDMAEDDYVRTPPRRTPPTRSIPLKEDHDFFAPNQSESPKRRRRRVDTVVNREGPIMKTKRKLLSEVDSDQTKVVATKVVTKRKVVSMGSEQAVVEREVKTRRVRKAKVEIEPVEKKKRKATRRKAKRKKPKKDIDEKALNDDLVKGFIDEEDE
jgi:hypothetical protein